MSSPKTTERIAGEARTERLGTPPAGRLVLGRYRLGERLGAGGFGVVWRAHDERLERDVAVKAIPFSGGADDDARIQREAVAAARLNHPGIVALYELGHDEHAAYLVSELVDGATLADLSREGAVSDRDVARIGAALCDALEHAHARGVVHRDVKPGNVMVLAEPAAGAGFAKLTDFGIARLASGDSLTATGDIVGTLAYMAPEQAEGRAVGPECDVYSLALTLYEAWTGTNPVRGASPAATARQVGAPLPPLRRQRRDLPAALCEVVDAALDPDPAYRPPLGELREVFADSEEELSDDGGLVEPDVIERFGLTAVTRRGTRITRFLRGRQLPPPIVVPGEDTRILEGADGEPIARRQPWPTLIAGRVAAGLAAALLVLLGVGLGPEPSFAVGTAALTAAGAVALLPRVGWIAVAMGVCAWLASEGGQEGTALALTVALLPIPLLLPRAGLLWSAAILAPLLGAIGLAPLFVGAAAWLGKTVWQRAGLAVAGLLWLRIAEVVTGDDLLYGSAPPASPRAGWEASVVDASRDAIEPVLTSTDPLLAIAWVGAAVGLGFLIRAWRGAALP
ncbi:MAG TPA: serine/threonine-protein kinase [Thermoleophilaceae bacterium]|nr:serine/threonine-protein kinase [Thermoleophilaceae bacterium]